MDQLVDLVKDLDSKYTLDTNKNQTIFKLKSQWTRNQGRQKQKPTFSIKKQLRNVDRKDKIQIKRKFDELKIAAQQKGYQGDIRDDSFLAWCWATNQLQDWTLENVVDELMFIQFLYHKTNYQEKSKRLIYDLAAELKKKHDWDWKKSRSVSVNIILPLLKSIYSQYYKTSVPTSLPQ